MKFEIFNDHFQNYKRYQIPKAQLVIADIPYNLGKNAYAALTLGILTVIIKMAKVKKQIQNFLILIKILESQNSCTFARKC